jgi:hypothetical protein
MKSFNSMKLGSALRLWPFATPRDEIRYGDGVARGIVDCQAVLSIADASGNATGFNDRVRREVKSRELVVASHRIERQGRCV